MCDLAFIGNLCFDEIVPFEGSPVIAPGTAVLGGALAAARIGAEVTAVTRMERMKDEGVGP